MFSAYISHALAWHTNAFIVGKGGHRTSDVLPLYFVKSDGPRD